MPSKKIQAVSFSGHGNNIVFGTRNEPISLSTLERDCFIIPVHSLDRFLPAGIPVSRIHDIHYLFWLSSYWILQQLKSGKKHLI